jgi:hypothetical protein
MSSNGPTQVHTKPKEEVPQARHLQVVPWVVSPKAKAQGKAQFLEVRIGGKSRFSFDLPSAAQKEPMRRREFCLVLLVCNS